MNKQKTSKVALFLLASFVILGSVIMWSLTSDLALAQTGSYPLVTLTAENNSKIIIKTQAVKFENGKWTYAFSWNRTRDTDGMIKIVPVVNESFIEAKLDPAPKESSSPWTVQLDPATRYVLRFYSAPSAFCDQNNAATDPDCLAFESVFFNTRDATGKLLSTAEIPVSQGGTRVDGATSTSGSGNSSGNVSLGSLQEQINNLLALVQSLIAQLSAKGVTYTGTTTVTTSTGNTTATGSQITGNTVIGGPVFFSVGANDNTAGGLRQAAEPLLVITNPTYNQVYYGTGGPGSDRVENGVNTREIWVYATEGRKFSTWVGYFASSCTDSSIQIQRSWNLPSGISFKQSCSADRNAITDGLLEGSAGSAGEYTSTITTTKTTSSGAVKAVTKIRFFVLKSNRSWPVSVQPIGTDGLPTSGSLSQGNRALISWSQDTQVDGSYFASQQDIWIAPASGNTGKHPDFVTDKQLIGTAGEQGGLNTDCNNSTRGGGDPYKTGCGSYNWLVGKTLGTNMAPGEYIIYVTPHLPIASRAVIGGLYGGCGLASDPTSNLVPNSVPGQKGGVKPQTDCYGYSYGTTRVRIEAGTGLQNTTPGILLASFSDIEGGLSYTRKNSAGQTIKSGSVGIGVGSNTDQAGCSMNETAGVSCGITINANVGDSLQIDWKSMYKGQPAGHSFDSTVFISGPYDKGNATELAAVRDCTQNIIAGGAGPYPSQAFMNSYQGSKTFTINPCMSGKVIYLTYTVWMYGCGNLTGGENYVASQTNPNLVLSSGQSTCRLAVKGEGTIIINVDRNSNIGEIVSGVPSSVPTAPYVENTSCTTGNSDDPAFVAGTKYIAAWNYPNISFNPSTDKLVFRAAKGASYSYQNGNWVKTNPSQDDVAKQAVNTGCPVGTTCHIKDNDVLANPQDPYRQETYYWVTGTEPRTTYWNRIAFVKNFGLSNQSIITEKTWSCNTQSGNLPR
jgi:hypothetical protein